MAASYRHLTGILAVVLMLGSPASAQVPATITGVVTTRADGLPVPGATVTLGGTTVKAITDAQGRYSIDLPPAQTRVGRVQLRVEALGMPARAYDVDLSQGPTTTFDVAISLGFEEIVTVGSRSPGVAGRKEFFPLVPLVVPAGTRAARGG